MKDKKKKQRVQFVSFKVYRLKTANYFQPIPYDNRRREIPSSVNVMYNLDYFTERECLEMLQTI
jgi:hypothetical protein